MAPSNDSETTVPAGHTEEGLAAIQEQRVGLGAVPGSTGPAEVPASGRSSKAGTLSEKDRLSGRTTADDPGDLGVHPKGRDGHQGPEDALDPDSVGDYRDRLGDANYSPHAGYAPQAQNAAPAAQETTD